MFNVSALLLDDALLKCVFGPPCRRPNWQKCWLISKRARQIHDMLWRRCQTRHHIGGIHVISVYKGRVKMRKSEKKFRCQGHLLTVFVDWLIIPHTNFRAHYKIVWLYFTKLGKHTQTYDVGAATSIPPHGRSASFLLKNSISTSKLITT